MVQAFAQLKGEISGVDRVLNERYNRYIYILSYIHIYIYMYYIRYISDMPSKRKTGKHAGDTQMLQKVLLAIFQNTRH